MSKVHTIQPAPRQYEVFFTNASFGIIVIDAAGKVCFCNPFFLSLFGYQEKEVAGKSIDMFIPSSYHREYDQYRKEFANRDTGTLKASGLDLLAVKKDGTEFPVEVSLGYYGVEEEKQLFVFVSDISKRVYDKAKIEKLKNELEESVVNRTRELTRTLSVMELLNEKLENTLINQNAILENAGVMLYATNPDGIIQFFNPEATRMTGYQESEVVNKLSSVIFHRPSDIQHCKKELKRSGVEANSDFEVISQMSLLRNLNKQDCFFINKNGEEIPVSLTMTPIWSKSKRLTGFMGVAVDMTQTKKIQAELMESLSKEKKLGEMKSRFVSIASHEFRTPLSTIMSSAFLVEKYENTSDQPKRKKHLDRIISAVNNLTNILNEFLSVGKIEEGKITVTPVSFNLKHFVSNLIGDVRGIMKKGQSIEHVHTGEEIVYLDNVLLSNIILNLLSNAIKFSDDSKPIIIYTEVDQKNVLISIKDHGLGIPKEDQEHLMECFYRGNNVTNIQGTGLGLHIVSKYVELMNGEMGFESEVNAGTTFTIKFKKIKPNEYEDNLTD